MRKALLMLLAVVFAAPIWAQNIDIESLSGLQFNFGNPGARSLGMGGAFLGLADDATAAEANPAGLTILRKPEFSLEGRNYLEQQVLTTSGTFPNLHRTGFTHYSDRVQISFASAVLPVKNRFTFGLYYHNPLRNQGAGAVIPVDATFTSPARDVPNFFLPRGGTPVTEKECQDLVNKTKDPFACLQFRITPFVSALDVDLRTYGFAAAWQIAPKFSVGATARYQTFSEQALTIRINEDTGRIGSVAAQATGTLNSSDEIVPKDEKQLTFAVGFKFAPFDKLSIGGVYKEGAEFDANYYLAGEDFAFTSIAATPFHIPDIAGLGVSFRPIPTLTINADAVNVKYSNLVDNFYATSENVRALAKAYEAKDVTELHVGGEYFFSTKVPFAVRAGYWHEPAHSIQYVGPLDNSDRVAEAVLFPKGEDQNHIALGAGLAWPRFQIDAAYEQSDRYKVGSISVVTRF